MGDQYQRQYIHDLIAEGARKAKVVKTMKETLHALEAIHQAGVVMDGEVHAVDFSNEILKLKAALQVAGGEEDEA